MNFIFFFRFRLFSVSCPGDPFEAASRKHDDADKRKNRTNNRDVTLLPYNYSNDTGIVQRRQKTNNGKEEEEEEQQPKQPAKTSDQPLRVAMAEW